LFSVAYGPKTARIHIGVRPCTVLKENIEVRFKNYISNICRALDFEEPFIKRRKKTVFLGVKKRLGDAKR
jgi:hypothetical protein